MSALAGNLGSLYRAHPELEERRMEELSESGDLRVLPAASGEPTATVAGVLVHSRYDPRREADRAVSSTVGGGVSAAVFYGFGLGYQVEAFRRQCPGVPAVVIEPETALFVEALGCRELTDTLGAPELFWHVGEEPEAAITSLDALPLGKLRVFRLPGLPERSLRYFRRVDGAIRALMDRREVNLNTLRRFGRLWIRNLTANLREFAMCPGVAELAGSFEGIPALVLAAGPSLDEILPMLADLRPRMLLVAVDTSFRLCRQSGVEPDFLVTVDPQYWNTRHLDRAALDEAVMVSESAAHPRLFRGTTSAPAPLYFVSSFFPLGRMLEEVLGSKGRVGAGGSVATTAWDLARLLGCRPLYMAGLDLGYPGSRTHCRGAFFEERMHCHARRLHPVESAQFQALHEAGPFLLENASGGMTLTDRRLLIYKWWFENQLAQPAARENPTFSLSGEGVRIGGMPFVSAASLRSLPEKRPLIEPRMEDIRRRALEHRRRVGEAGLRTAVSLLHDLAEDLERLRGLSARGGTVCRRLRRLVSRGAAEARARSGLLMELDRIDADILELSSRNVAGFLFQGLIHRIVDAPGGERTLPEVLELSEALYDELEASGAYHLELVRTAVSRGRKSLKFPGNPPKL